jgi:hypothetical protein
MRYKSREGQEKVYNIKIHYGKEVVGNEQYPVLKFLSQKVCEMVWEDRRGSDKVKRN